MGSDSLLTALRRLAASLPPGSPLPGQRALCVQYGATTFSLHKAVQQLEREGLVDVAPRKGVFVREKRPTLHRRVEIIYLDDPVQRVREYGLTSFVAVTSRMHMECRAAHVRSGDVARLRSLMQAAAADPACLGAVVCGSVPAETEKFLRGLDQPWVMLGDGHRLAPLEGMPIVCGDGFQGGQLGVQYLISKGCASVVLVNFRTEPDWPWVVETRAGALSAACDIPCLEMFLPVNDCLRRPREFEAELEQWAARERRRGVGVMCRGLHAFHMATPARQLFRTDPGLRFVLLEINQFLATLPGVHQVFCSLEAQAEVAIRRLMAMRCGLDQGGRVRVPYISVFDEAEQAAPVSSVVA